ncbi:hypothetical protein DSO57_1005561 [Entomophthora muscae]|uniref:Uncharacterized protein n=1 Tax=Entomophthora muscae TaxID=34485 RepID=A0ACC2UH98_9FUNG|nr:hypothetical protein DSO57_1005561 [Entomophthora muscae]
MSHLGKVKARLLRSKNHAAKRQDTLELAKVGQVQELKSRVELAKDFDTMLLEGFPTLDNFDYDMTLRVSLTPEVAGGISC